jgi:hypothetical protein
LAPATVRLVEGLNLVASPLRRAGYLGPEPPGLQFPAQEGDTVHLYTANGYTSPTREFDAWSSEPLLREAEAFFASLRTITPRIWLQTSIPGSPALTSVPRFALPTGRARSPRDLHQTAGVDGWVQLCNQWPDSAAAVPGYPSVPAGPPLDQAGVRDDYHANLWFGPSTNDLDLREASRPGLPAPILERGFFQGGTVRVSDATATQLWARIRVWPRSHRQFEEARRNGDVWVFESNPFPIAPTADINAPANLTGLTRFDVKPRLLLGVLPDRVPFGTPPLLLNAIPRDGQAGPISYTVEHLSGTGVAVIEAQGNRRFLSLTGIGTVRVNASQAAGGDYLEALASREITVTQALQSISLPVPAELNIGSANVGVEAFTPVALELPARADNASAPGLPGLPLTFGIVPADGATVQPGAVATRVLFRRPGSFTLTASQHGDTRFGGASDVTRPIEIVQLSLDVYFDRTRPGWRAVQLQAALGSRVRLEWSIDPAHGGWNTLREMVVDQRLTAVEDPEGADQTRYYRAVAL